MGLAAAADRFGDRNGLAEAKKRAPDEPDTKKPSSDAGSDEATRLMETVTDRLSKILNGEPQR